MDMDVIEYYKKLIKINKNQSPRNKMRLRNIYYAFSFIRSKSRIYISMGPYQLMLLVNKSISF